VLVPLARYLLRAGQERLDTAEIDQAVAIVGLLHDARDDVADAVLVLLEHHVPLDLADPLQNDLLRGLRGDAAEVVGRRVVRRDAMLGQAVPGDDRVRLLRLGLRLVGALVERRTLAARPLRLDRYLRLGLRLRVGQQAEVLERVVVRVDLQDPEVAGLAVDHDAGVPTCSRGLLVGGAKRLLEGHEEHLRVDALLRLQLVDGVQDLLAHFGFTNFQRHVAFLMDR
jgi:hypothetical protein